MPKKKTYISIDDFASLQSIKRPYEGFVRGLGYAYVGTVGINPPNCNGFSHVGHIPPQLNRFVLVHHQYVDNSPEMIEESMQELSPNGAVIYTVQYGDTLTSIAQQYRVSINDLVRWNKLADPNRIQIGQKLVVSEASKDVLKSDGASYNLPVNSIEMRTLNTAQVGSSHFTNGVMTSKTLEVQSNFFYSTSLSAHTSVMENTDALVHLSTTSMVDISGNNIGLTEGVAVGMASTWGTLDQNGFSVGGELTLKNSSYNVGIGANKQGITMHVGYSNRTGGTDATSIWTGNSYDVTMTFKGVAVIAAAAVGVVLLVAFAPEVLAAVFGSVGVGSGAVWAIAM